MRTMIDMGRERGPIGMHIINTATTVDCSSREVGLRRSLRSLLDCIVPACCAAGFEPHSPNTNLCPDSSSSSSFSSDTDSPSSSSSTTMRSLSTSSTTVKGTFFGQRNGRVSFCLQDDTQHQLHHRRTPSRRMTTNTISSFAHPLLLLEFAVPTSYLAKEMQHGLLRIALVEEDSTHWPQPPTNGGGGIFEVPVWSMYCNGRKVGYATRRKMTAADTATLTHMQSVSVGAGVLPPEKNHGADGTMYLRASFRRIIGSPNSESFHMINPDKDERSSFDSHSVGQELSIFLLRSSS